MLQSELSTLKFSGDVARKLKISRQWLLEVRREANIPCLMLGDYFLWSPEQIEQARQIIEKRGVK